MSNFSQFDFMQVNHDWFCFYVEDDNNDDLDIDWFLCEEDSGATPVTLNKTIDVSGIVFNGSQTTLSISYWNSNVTSEKKYL